MDRLLELCAPRKVEKKEEEVVEKKVVKPQLTEE
jgi:hypothetical protein